MMELTIENYKRVLAQLSEKRATPEMIEKEFVRLGWPVPENRPQRGN